MASATSAESGPPRSTAVSAPEVSAAPRRLLLRLDDPARLVGPALDAALTAQGPWQGVAATPAAAARLLLDGTPFDAVVMESRDARGASTDLRAGLRDRSPRTPRILLVAADPDAVIRGLAVAHRVLPCGVLPGVLGETVLRVVRLNTLLDSARLADLLGRVEHLPPAPRIYLRITEAMCRDGVGALELADLVAADPALAAEVLRVANTAFFSTGRPLADLHQAVQRLGTRTLRHLVLACEAFATRPGPTAGDPSTVQRRALLASILAPLVLDQWAEAELARTAALLADIGLLLPPLPRGDGPRPPHAEAGAALLARWGLPDAVVEAIAFRYDPAGAGESRFGLVGAVHVAAALANGEPFDEAYLSAHGLQSRLDAWRKLASELAAMS
ncbi:MAG: HDOD domain-containing protein [Pseudomonadota bacterium]